MLLVLNSHQDTLGASFVCALHTYGLDALDLEQDLSNGTGMKIANADQTVSARKGRVIALESYCVREIYRTDEPLLSLLWLNDCGGCGRTLKVAFTTIALFAPKTLSIYNAIGLSSRLSLLDGCR